MDRGDCRRRFNVPDEVVSLFTALQWCGDTIDLNKPAAKSFQGWDCYGKGRPHRNKDGRYVI